MTRDARALIAAALVVAVLAAGCGPSLRKPRPPGPSGGSTPAVSASTPTPLPTVEERTPTPAPSPSPTAEATRTPSSTPSPTPTAVRTAAPAAPLTGVTIVDAVIAAALSRDPARLEALVVGMDQPCGQDGLTCTAGNPPGASMRAFYTVACSAEWGLVSERAGDPNIRGVATNVSALAGVFRVRDGRELPAGDYFVFFKSRRYSGLEGISVGANGIVGFYAPVCGHPLRPDSIAAVALILGRQADLIYVP